MKKLVVLALLLTACGPALGQESLTTQDQSDTNRVEYTTEVLPDGREVECLVFEWRQAAGLSCNWPSE